MKMESITIHRGEIMQIHRMITKYRKTKGNLYGLYTESKRPVILIVFGGYECERNPIDEKLRNEHGLKKLGEWFVEDTASRRKDYPWKVSLAFNAKGELIGKTIDDSDVQCEIIEDQSAFRLFESVIDMLEKTTKIINSKIEIEVEKPAEIQVQNRQWYSTEEGQNLLKEIFSQLPENGFESPQMSRYTATQDLTMVVHDHSHIPIKIDFPYDFPSSLPCITYRSDEPVELQVHRHQVAESLCSALFDHINFKNIDSDKQTEDSHSLKNMNMKKDQNKLPPESDKNQKQRGLKTAQKQPHQAYGMSSHIKDKKKEQKERKEETKNGQEKEEDLKEKDENQKEGINDQKEEKQEKEETSEYLSTSVNNKVSTGSKKCMENVTDSQASSCTNVCKESTKEFQNAFEQKTSDHLLDQLEQKRSLESHINRIQGTKKTQDKDEESNASFFDGESKMEVEEGSDFHSECEAMDTEL